MNSTTIPDAPLIIYDGACGFCNRTVRLIAALDKAKRFYFAPNSGETASRLLRRFNIEGEEHHTLIFIYRNAYFTRSRAVIEICNHIRHLKWLGILLRCLPFSLREWGYRQIAHRRYWFGRTDSCPLPPAQLRKHFLP